MNNKRVVIAVFLFLAILMCMFTVRDSTIKEYDWKVTSGANLNNDFIYFFKDSVYTYSCPLIREKGDIV
ncbi:MAG: hypothetical protein MJZ24_04850, partial [Paludibacteraceae bacterium]|nr:hypothetical protein [Paludibacteraceae bacterium]